MAVKVADLAITMKKLLDFTAHHAEIYHTIAMDVAPQLSALCASACPRPRCSSASRLSALGSRV